MPSLDIDHKRPLTNTTAPYAQHILIPTGQHDWTSRIEDEGCTSNSWGRLTAYLKHEFGPKGSAHDSNHPMLITASSFSPPATAEPPPQAEEEPTGSLLLFPSFRHYAHLPLTTSSLPNLLPAIRSSLPPNTTSPSASPLPYTPITTPTVLICSHASRDSRCGTLGPVLQAEFTRQLAHLGITANTSAFVASQAEPPEAGQSTTRGIGVSVNVGCISHVGGHRWAGNVIVYVPPAAESTSPLAGCGVWYGRVEPRHVEGIVRETVLGGRVIGELWRGGVGRDGRMIRV